MPIVSRINIDIQLNKIESLFNDAFLHSPDPVIPEFYSKLFIIEVCGWIEETTDAVLVTGYLDRYRIANPRVKPLVDNNYKFDYESMRKMNMNVLGAKNFEHVEARLKRKLDNGKTFPSFSDFKGSLTFLTKARNKIAHTQIDGIKPPIDAPSVIKPHYEKVLIGLKIFEAEVLRL